MALSFLLLCVFTGSAFSQGAQTGGIIGDVKDPKGGLVGGAKVEIYNEATGRLERSLTTGTDGSYVAPLLPPGSYRVEVSVQGFKKHQAAGVQVRITETTRHDVTLELGGVTETIVVEATPTLINPVNATTGQPIDPATLSSLPLASPNFLFLLTLSTGAGGEPPDVRKAGRGNIDINVNGQRTTNNSVSIEGINVNDFNLAHFDTVPLPNPSTIQEFKVATSLYDASLGSKGGGAISLVLKSGTKDLHGSAYWGHRNDVFNANEWFNKNTSPIQPRGRLLQNVFGTNGSGPAWKLGGFWFANYQGVRNRNGIDTAGAVTRPTIPVLNTASDGTVSAASLAAQFSTPTAPLTAAAIDPVALNILNLKKNFYGGTFLIPRLGQAGCPTTATGGNFICTFQGIIPGSDNQYTISYDRPMRGNKDKLAVRWFYDNGTATGPFAAGGSLRFPSTSVQRNRFLSINHTQQFSSSQLNEFRFGYSRFNSSFVPSDIVKLSDVGATRPNSAELPGIYALSITGLFSLGTGVNDDRGTISNTFYWADTWSMVKSKHTFRAGTEISRYQLNRYNRFAVRGSLGFDDTPTSTPAFGPFANFLQGRATSLQSAGGDPQRYFRATDVSAFFQDDWRIHPRVTLNLGLRWEGLAFSHEKFQRLGNYDPALLLLSPPKNPFVFPAEANFPGFTGTPGVGGCTLNDCFPKKNFAPRVSFAWDVSGNQKTVVRAGYGIYYQRLSNQNILQTNLAPPFNVQNIDSRPTGRDAAGNPAGLANPFPTGSAASLIDAATIPQLAVFAGVVGNINTAAGRPLFRNQDGRFCSGFAPTGTPTALLAVNCAINLASFTSPPRDIRTPYTQQWNLTVQRDLLKGWAVEVGYVGSHYVRGLGIFNPFVRLASPSNPIVVTDVNGVSHTITTNTPNNEPLRHAVLGLARSKGARFTGNIGFAIYHSAQLTVSHRFHGGLFFQGGYTFSKTIDNVSGSQSTDELNITRAGQGGANLVNLGNIDPRLNRARGDFDRPHRLVVSYSWDLPARKNGIWGSQVFQGWALSGIVTYQSGLPFSVTAAGGGAYGSGGISTAQLICAPTAQQDLSLPTCTPGTVTTVQQALLPGSLQSRLGHYINPNFFSANTVVPNGVAGATDYGNVPRNAFRAPFQQDWDFSVAKKFRITERHSIGFRTDFFNLFNHPVFQTPSSVSIGTRQTFGQIKDTAVPARLIQFGLKYSF